MERQNTNCIVCDKLLEKRQKMTCSNECFDILEKENQRLTNYLLKEKRRLDSMKENLMLEYEVIQMQKELIIIKESVGMTTIFNTRKKISMD